ncbi:unnamed protein product, partial [Scytosiphon promiscuus]
MTSLDFQSLLKQEKARRRAELAGDLHSTSRSRAQKVRPDHRRGSTPVSPLSRDEDGEATKECSYRSAISSQFFVELAARPSLDLEKASAIFLARMRVGSTPSIYYAPDFISQADERQILAETYAPVVDGHSADSSEWVALRSRRLKCWGGQPGENFRPEPLPPWVEALCDSLVARGVFREDNRPNHVLLNEYQPGQGIMGHTDGPFYEPRTATLSLGSDAVMHFSPRVETSRIGTPGVETRPQASLVLRARCLVIFAEEAYSDLLHSIDAVREETVGGVGDDGGGSGGAVVVNADAAGAPEGTTLRRKMRVSLTFRRVRA